MTTARLALPHLLAFLTAAHAPAQPTTTVVTHGFTIGDKGVWVQAMAEAVVQRAGAGRIYRYEFAKHAHRWNPVANPPGLPDDPDTIVLIFNWTPDSGLNVAGENWHFAQAAADALHAALRDADYAADPGPTDLAADRALHLIGHSRGAVVNSEAARRLALAGIPIDQVTTLDPHPVNGTLDDCNPFEDLDWGDPVPAKWDAVAWADNYWRQDANVCDFDGMPLDLASQAQLDESALAEGGYDFEHSDVHLWYHATIDFDGEACDGVHCVSPNLRALWFDPPEPNPLYDDQFGGYYYSVVGGGSADRPDQPAGTDSGQVPVIWNGAFEKASVAGWRYHAGDVAPADLDEDAGDAHLRLDAANPDASHNRFLLPAGAADATFRYRVFTPSADDALALALIDDDGAAHATDGIPLSAPTGDFIQATLPLPGVPTGRAYRLAVAIDPGPDGLVQAVAGVDDVDITLTDCAADFNGDGALNVLDFVAFQNAFTRADPAADCDDNAVLDVLDFICFQQLFQAGCD